MDRIEKQLLRLSSRVWQDMKELGLELITPPGPRSGIVTCVVDDGQAVGQLLKENGIVASVNLGEGTAHLAAFLQPKGGHRSADLCLGTGAAIYEYLTQGSELAGCQWRQAGDR